MSKEQVHVGLEIGTSKVCAVVALCRGATAPIRILGVGEAASCGVRKGDILNFSTASKCVHEALIDAEEKSDIQIKSVWVAITGSHLTSFNNRGGIELSEHKNEIDEADLHDVELNAKEVSVPANQICLHTILNHYYVDGTPGVVDPIGMVGKKLEADYHIVYGLSTKIQNTIRCVKEAGIEVEDVVISSIASAQVVLKPHETERGVIVLDIGGGITDYIVYINNVVRCSGTLAVGGDHLTQDLAIGLHIPPAHAEKLKCKEGSCKIDGLTPADTIVLKSDPSFNGCEIQRLWLNTIIRVRVKEIFQIIARKIATEHDFHTNCDSVVITGGTSKLQGIQAVANEVFEIPTRLAFSQNVTGLTSSYENPALSTPIGLVKYAQVLCADNEAPSLVSRIINLFGRR